MNGAVIYPTGFPSTQQYARWIAQACDLELLDLEGSDMDSADYRIVVLTGPISRFRSIFERWIDRNSTGFATPQILLVTVSDDPTRDCPDGWVPEVFSSGRTASVGSVVLRGVRLCGRITPIDRAMLILASLDNPDAESRRSELGGYDYMDEASLLPAIERIRAVVATTATKELCGP